jgi:hypothetical protein
MSITCKDVMFFLVTAVYSLASTRLTIGLPLGSRDEIINAIALGIVAGIGGCVAYRARPDQALSEIFRKPVPKP